MLQYKLKRFYNTFEDLKKDILKIYPGQVQGKMKQVASITKRGFKVY